MRAQEFITEQQKLFKDHATKNSVYNLLVQATDAGPFDGGCVVFAQALQMLLGGDIVVLTNAKGQAEHAVTKVGNQYWDFDGAASEQGMLARFSANERRQVTAVRPITDNDLPDAPRDAQAAAKIAAMMSSNEVHENSEKVYYHGTKAAEDFDNFEVGKAGHGIITFDRLLGPHFSSTPALANLFATKDPNIRGRSKPPTGGRVIPVHLSGNVYTLPQKGREDDYMALARDAGTKVFTAHPEIHEAFKRAWYEDSKVGTNVTYEKWQERMFDPGLELFGIRDWGLDYLATTTNVNLIKTIATAYKDMLISQGFGIIKYRNTGRKERVGLYGEDLDSFIALLPPKFKFARAA